MWERGGSWERGFSPRRGGHWPSPPLGRGLKPRSHNGFVIAESCKTLAALNKLESPPPWDGQKREDTKPPNG